MDHVVGLTIRTKTGRPFLCGVVIPADEVDLGLRAFSHLASRDARPEEQLNALGQALESELAVQDVTAVVVREAGYARGSGFTASVKNRLRAEGIALGVARSVTEAVAITDANGIGHLLGLKPAEADALAESMVAADWVDAGTAAMAARRIG